MSAYNLLVTRDKLSYFILEETVVALSSAGLSTPQAWRGHVYAYSAFRCTCADGFVGL